MRLKHYFLVNMTCNEIVYEFFAENHKEAVRLMFCWLRFCGIEGHDYDLVSSQLYNFIHYERKKK